MQYYNWLRQNKNTGIELTHTEKRDGAKRLLLSETDARKIEQMEREDWDNGERGYDSIESFPNNLADPAQIPIITQQILDLYEGNNTGD